MKYYLLHWSSSRETVKELKRINDALASELLTPELGVPFGSALSGFDAAWEEQQAIQREWIKNNPGADLFPDPLKGSKVQSLCHHQIFIYREKRGSGSGVVRRPDHHTIKDIEDK